MPAFPARNIPTKRRAPGARRNTFVLLLSAAAAAFLALTIYTWLHPAPEIPRPAAPDELQPQLHSHLLQLVAQAEKAPRDPMSHATLGIAYAANQLWNEAERCFKNAVLLNPDEPLAHLYLAISREELGDYPEALRLYRDLVARFPAFPQGYSRLGKLSLQLGALDSAQQAFSQLVELEPKEWRGHAGLGEVALRRARYAEAAAHLEKAVALDPQAGNAHSLLGLAYRGLGRLEEAEFEMARGKDSQTFPMSDAWGETAREHMRLVQDQIEIANRYSLEGAVDHAIAILANAVSYNPTNQALLNTLAIVLDRGGRPAEAQAVLNRLFAHNEDYLPAIITASRVAQSLGQTSESLAFAHRAVLLSPNSSHSLVALANALLAAEMDIPALEALQKASELDPKNAELLLQMGDILLLNLDRPDEALQHYQSACKLDPVLISARIRLARLWIERNDESQARKSLAVIRKLAPAHPALAILERQLEASEQSPELEQQSPGSRLGAPGQATP